MRAIPLCTSLLPRINENSPSPLLRSVLKAELVTEEAPNRFTTPLMGVQVRQIGTGMGSDW
jgi:hypothetical protein